MPERYKDEEKKTEKEGQDNLLDFYALLLKVDMRESPHLYGRPKKKEDA